MAALTTLPHPLYKLTAMPVFTSLAILVSALLFSSSVISIFFPVLPCSQIKHEACPSVPQPSAASQTGGELQFCSAASVIYAPCPASTEVASKLATYIHDASII